MDKIIESWMALCDRYPSENKISQDDLDDLYDIGFGAMRVFVGGFASNMTRSFAWGRPDDCHLWFERTGEREIRVNAGKDYALITLDDHYPVLAEKAPDLIIAELKAENKALKEQIEKIKEVLEIE